MNHACEFETSLYLALRPELVDMTKAVAELSHRPSKNYWTDLIAGDGPLAMMEHWSRLSRSGVMGDPTKASAEKGRALLDAAAEWHRRARRRAARAPDASASRITTSRSRHIVLHVPRLEQPRSGRHPVR